MESLIENFRLRLSQVKCPHRRYLYDKIDWDYPLVSITGSRGVGKTTLLLQYIKDHHSNQLDKVLYASLDLPYFYDRSLFSLADEFQKKEAYGFIWMKFISILTGPVK